MSNTKTLREAISILDGVARLARQERLMRMTYYESGYSCGTKGCLVGSLYVSAKIPVTACGDLPGTAPGQREDFMADRPGLLLAYNTLNECAEPKCDSEYWAKAIRQRGAAETYFEHVLPYHQIQTGVIELAAEAREQLTEQLAAELTVGLPVVEGEKVLA